MLQSDWLSIYMYTVSMVNWYLAEPSLILIRSYWWSYYLWSYYLLQSYLLEDRRLGDVTKYSENISDTLGCTSSRLPLFCYHILTTSVIYHQTDARQYSLDRLKYERYILTIHNENI